MRSQKGGKSLSVNGSDGSTGLATRVISAIGRQGPEQDENPRESDHENDSAAPDAMKMKWVRQDGKSASEFKARGEREALAAGVRTPVFGALTDN